MGGCLLQHMQQVHRQIPVIFGTIVRKQPWQHVLDTVEMQFPVSFPCCWNEAQHQLNQVKVTVPENLYGAIVFVAELFIYCERLFERFALK